MKRSSLLLAVALGLAACGGSDSPAVSSVTVTVTLNGTALPDSPVVASTGVDITPLTPVPTGVIATQNTNASGQTVFTVPSSTPTGSICFSSTVSYLGGVGFDSECHSLSTQPATIALTH
jgi:hypothetical protein